jgi:SAM-dependent methyltransferase
VTEAKGFDPREYWEQRLTQSYGLHGVGYAPLGLSFNRWMYRVRKNVFRRVVRKLVRDGATTRVLDVGVGTGFYVDQWRSLGVRKIVGLDLTETSVSHLRTTYPDLDFVVADVGAEQIPLDAASFDIVSAFDVLFHIVDDDRYARAMKNIFDLLKPGGSLVWSDNFLRHSRREAGVHQVSRSLEESSQMLRDAGFEIVSRKPMFWLMNGPVDSTGRIMKTWWRLLMSLVRRGDRMANLTGAALYLPERVLTRVMSESPTTEIMVCRKPAAPRD